MEHLKIVSDAEIDAVWGNANFGSMPRREVIDDTVLKIAGGFSTGNTACVICSELGLLKGYRTKRGVSLTKKGQQYLYYSVTEKRNG